jgi:TolB-like protein
MNIMGNDDYSNDADVVGRNAEAVDRYLADEMADADAAVFPRCDAVMALIPRLTKSAGVAWAFDEARELAKRDPRKLGRPALARWLREPALAWGAAGVLAVALVISIQPGTPDATANAEPTFGENVPGQIAQAAAQPTVQNITFAPIVVSTELAQTLAEIRPGVLLANQMTVDSRSLAVMPFTASLSAAAQRIGVISADSIYTQVYRQLAAIPGIYLIDPATAAIYANSDLPAAEIAQQLGVRGIVDGNLDSINGSIHFSLNFTDAATLGGSINRSIERPAAEAALLQSDIASSVLDALARTPRPEPREQIL